MEDCDGVLQLAQEVGTEVTQEEMWAKAHMDKPEDISDPVTHGVFNGHRWIGFVCISNEFDGLKVVVLNETLDPAQPWIVTADDDFFLIDGVVDGTMTATAWSLVAALLKTGSIPLKDKGELALSAVPPA